MTPVIEYSADPGGAGPTLALVPMMPARQIPVAVVCKFPFPVDGRPAFYVVDYHGVESELTLVDEGETEQEVIDRLSDALWVTRPRGASGRPVPRPLLRLL